MQLIKIFLSLMVIAVVAWGTPPNTDEERVDVNFRNLNVKDFIEMVGKITQKNILITSDLKGTVNFVSQTPIKKSSLITLANSILANSGLTLVDKGDYYQVIKANEALGEGLAVTENVEDADSIQTVVFNLKNNNASVIRAKIKPLLHKNAESISFQDNNLLTISANPKTIRAIEKIITAIEEKGEKNSAFIKLENSSVKDVFPNVTNMAKNIFPAGVKSEQVDIFKDDATNMIILVGKNANMNKMITYIKKLDIKGQSLTQQMYVIPLKNSNVEDMQKIISQLVAQMNNMTPNDPAKKAPDGKDAPKAMVVSDIERNALVVLADGDQIKNIKSTIAKLDVAIPQVYVMAKIVEINTELAKQLGLRYGFESGKITSQGLFTLAANSGAPSLMISDSLMAFLNQETVNYQYGNPVTTTEKTFSFDSGIKEMLAMGAKLDLMQENGAAHILSEPSVLCVNNKEASIYVGKTQSIMTQAQQSTQGQGNIINNYSREDIGITLKVKPRLSSNNKVSLEVETTIEDVLPTSTVNADRPTTTKRKILTHAIVNNGETIILGGLIKNSGGKSVVSLPILGDIPILGELFKSKSDYTGEINVVVYLTPFIVRKNGDLERLKRVLTELEDVQIRYNKYIKEALDRRKGTKSIFGGVTTSGTHPAKSRTTVTDDMLMLGNF